MTLKSGQELIAFEQLQSFYLFAIALLYICLCQYRLKTFFTFCIITLLHDFFIHIYIYICIIYYMFYIVKFILIN